MSAGNGNPPPNKWGKVPSGQLSSDQVLNILNNASVQITAAFDKRCADGDFLFIGNYTEESEEDKNESLV
jgi:hypothetical protein